MTDNLPLEGRTALVTGASSGIGRETANALAARGSDVALAARSEGKLTELADRLREEHGIEPLVIPTNVRDEGEVEQLVTETVETFGALDIVVSNAGVGAPGTRIEEFGTDSYRRLMETNVDGTFFLTRESLPYLLETSGNLIFMGSLAGQFPRPATPMYAAAKWWIRGFALSIQGMYGDEGVAVTVVNPAEVRTDIEVLGKPMTSRFEEGEVSEPAEVAEAVAFAAEQDGNSTVSELDLYWHGKLGQF